MKPAVTIIHSLSEAERIWSSILGMACLVAKETMRQTRHVERTLKNFSIGSMDDVAKVEAVLRDLAATGHSLHYEDMAIAILAAIRPTFSKLVIQNNEASFECPTCNHTERVYKIGWRACYPTVLRMFRRHGTMTTPQLANHIDSPTIRKTPSELVKFGLLDAAGTRGGDALYKISSHGKRFLDGEEKAYSWVREDERLPEEYRYGQKFFIHELADHHSYNDRKAHMQESLAV